MILTSTYLWSGIGRYVRMIQNLDNNIWEISLNGNPSREVSYIIPSYHWSVSEFLIMLNKIKINTSDTHVIIASPDLYSMVRNYKDKYKIAVIYDTFWREYHYELGYKLFLEYNFNYLDKFDEVITVSNYMAGKIYKITGIKPKVIYPYVEPVNMRVNTAEKKFITYIASSEERKNIPFFIDFAYYMKEIIDYDFVRIGADPKEIKMVLKKYKNNFINIIYKNKISDLEIDNILAKSLVYIHPSKDEGFGLPLLDAMKFGLPVITLKKPIYEEILNGQGFYIPEEIAVWSNVLLRIIYEYRIKYIENPIQYDLSRFSKDKFLEKWKDVLEVIKL